MYPLFGVLEIVTHLTQPSIRVNDSKFSIGRIKQKTISLRNRKKVTLHLLKAKNMVESNTKSLTHLSSLQIANRYERIRDLRRYISDEQYPINQQFQSPTPFIQDESGTLCAMAYLVQKSGYPKVVDELDREGRNFKIKEFMNPNLPIWLDRQGITKEEAAQIQPIYHSVIPVIDDPVKWVTFVLQVIVLVVSIVFFQIKTKWTAKLREAKRYQGAPIISIFGILLLFTLFLVPIELFNFNSDGGSLFFQDRLFILLMSFIVLLLTLTFYISVLLSYKIPNIAPLTIFFLHLIYLPTLFLVATRSDPLLFFLTYLFHLGILGFITVRLYTIDPMSS